MRFERYYLSDQVFAILERFSPLIEPLSIDEAFLDVTGCERLLGPAAQIAAEIKRQARRETQLDRQRWRCANKFLAKAASDLKKPDGLVVVPPGGTCRGACLDRCRCRGSGAWGPRGPSSGSRSDVRTIGQLRGRRRRCSRTASASGDRLAAAWTTGPWSPTARPRASARRRPFLGRCRDRRPPVPSCSDPGGGPPPPPPRAQGQDQRAKIRDHDADARSRTLPEATTATETLWQAAEGILAAWCRSRTARFAVLGVTASGLQEAGTHMCFTAPCARQTGRLDKADTPSRADSGRWAPSAAGCAVQTRHTRFG